MKKGQNLADPQRQYQPGSIQPCGTVYKENSVKPQSNSFTKPLHKSFDGGHGLEIC